MRPNYVYLPAIGRLLIAFIFVFSGFGKIAAPDATIASISAAGLPLPIVGYCLSILVEIGGGLLLIFGFQTRVVAALLAAFSLVTAAVFHRDFANPNMLIHFLKNVSMAGGLLQVVAFGPGAFSVDAWREQPRAASPSRSPALS